MLTYVPMDAGDLAGKDWMWIEASDGSRYMLLAEGREVTISDRAVKSIVCQADEARQVS